MRNAVQNAAHLVRLATIGPRFTARWRLALLRRRALERAALVVGWVAFAAGRVAGAVRFGRPLTVRAEVWQHLTGRRPFHVLTDAAKDQVDDMLYMLREVHPCEGCADDRPATFEELAAQFAAAADTMDVADLDDLADPADEPLTVAELATQYGAPGCDSGMSTAEHLELHARGDATPDGCAEETDADGNRIGFACYLPTEYDTVHAECAGCGWHVARETGTDQETGWFRDRLNGWREYACPTGGSHQPAPVAEQRRGRLVRILVRR